jgi:ribonuclease III
MQPDASSPSVARLLTQLGAGAEAADLLTAALTHRSWSNENPGAEAEERSAANERLEFLGDAVLGLAVARWLYARWPGQDEGALSKAKARLVSTAILARHARRLDLGTLLRLGRGEERSGGRDRDSLLADALEAVLGALFLSRGFEAAERFVQAWWEADLESESAAPGTADHKSLLQEASQKAHGELPTYAVERVAGPDHARSYEVSVSVGGREFGRGRGKSKKDAEQSAAALALAKIAAPAGRRPDAERRDPGAPKRRPARKGH